MPHSDLIGNREVVFALGRHKGLENEMQKCLLGGCYDQTARSYSRRVLTPKHLEQAGDVLPNVNGDVNDAAIQKVFDARRQTRSAIDGRHNPIMGGNCFLKASLCLEKGPAGPVPRRTCHRYVMP